MTVSINHGGTVNVAPVREPDFAIFVMTGLATSRNIEPKVTPISPPKKPMAVASMVKILLIVLRLAPSARITPISRIR